MDLPHPVFYYSNIFTGADFEAYIVEHRRAFGVVPEGKVVNLNITSQIGNNLFAVACFGTVSRLAVPSPAAAMFARVMAMRPGP